MHMSMSVYTRSLLGIELIKKGIACSGMCVCDKFRVFAQATDVLGSLRAPLSFCMCYAAGWYQVHFFFVLFCFVLDVQCTYN